MHIEEPVTTVILLGATKPEPNLEKEMEAYGMRVRWAQTIKDATELLNSMVNRTVVLAELSVKDGNWRDLLEVVRCSSIPVVLMSPASTAELWWDALDCGVDDIVPAPISASQLCEYVQKEFTKQK